MKKLTPLLAAALPLAGLTAVGMLATDLMLPGVPAMQAQLGASIAQGQATLAGFVAALALSQLMWGWAADHFGERPVLLAGAALLCGASVLAALTADIDVLVAARVLQGLGAGAATVVAPVLLRRRFAEGEAVRAISLVGMAESLVPAFGPVAGAVVIAGFGWRATFWIIAVLAALLAPFALHVARGASTPPGHAGGFGGLLSNVTFRGYAASHAFTFGALIMFVSSAPQVVALWLGLGMQSFAVLQMCGVGAFILAAGNGGRMADRLGMQRTIMIGAALQAAAGVGMLALALADLRSHAALLLAWPLFCAGLGLRAPSTMTSALSAATSDAGKAAGLLMFGAFAMSALATQGVAGLLEHGLLPVAALLLAMVVLSVLVLPRSGVREANSHA